MYRNPVFHLFAIIATTVLITGCRNDADDRPMDRDVRGEMKPQTIGPGGGAMSGTTAAPATPPGTSRVDMTPKSPARVDPERFDSPRTLPRDPAPGPAAPSTRPVPASPGNQGAAPGAKP